MLTSTSTTRIRPHERAKSSSRRNTATGHARPFDTRGAEPAPRGAGAH
jgi:hypothetical protein